MSKSTSTSTQPEVAPMVQNLESTTTLKKVENGNNGNGMVWTSNRSLPSPSHCGHFVQLLAIVHRIIPIQYKTSAGGNVIRTDIQVGDDTRPYFPVSVWQKHMGSMLTAGSIVLLQNVKVTQFGDIVEARTVQQSSIQCLVDTYEAIHSEGHFGLLGYVWYKHFDEDFSYWTCSKEKLRKVIAWVLRTGPILNKPATNHCKSLVIQIVAIDHRHLSYSGLIILYLYYHLVRIELHVQKNQKSANWKLPEEIQTKDCLSLLEVSNLNDSCNVSVFASIAEMFLPMTTTTSEHLCEFEEERMFIRSRLSSSSSCYKNLAEDLLCTGCELCGAPLNSEIGYNNALLLVLVIVMIICVVCVTKSVGIVMDDRCRIEQETSPPLYCDKSSNRLHVVSFIYRPFLLYIWDEWTCIPVVVKNKAAQVLFGNIKAESVYSTYKNQNQIINFYSLWLILLKALLKKNSSPFKFKLRIDITKTSENGRFEITSLSLPPNLH
ncbi:hypothetical protein OSB04_005593 [Centaurea solstitialis]|uniref:Uncharacterized protein n=1 Tax=Centaurea solstitialis TaxID=347529 RepID=A0AA38TNZ7_9ASTR|nr:hypothetical protein OSB04_005593 [Centaurea solstitialis]